MALASTSPGSPPPLAGRPPPADLHDFEVDLRLWHLVRRAPPQHGQVVWSPARWQNLALTVGGLLCLLGFYVLPAMHWDEIREAGTWVLSAIGLLLAVLLVPILGMTGMGLFHWPRLVIDLQRRELLVYRRFAGEPDVDLRFDEIERLTIDRLSTHDGTEPSGPFRVLYAELTDGRRAALAVEPCDHLVEELTALVAPRREG